jgi:16S rRNA (cytidine1402-2'-O)-methyltransferase
MKGSTYMIPCPIADRESVWEVLPKANLDIMNSLDYFIVENTRSARRFLSKAGIERKIEELEFVELNEHTTSAADIERMLKPIIEGRSAGVISEAGVPGVADPGADIVALAHRCGIRVMPLVGPSSILMAMMPRDRTDSRLPL